MCKGFVLVKRKQNESIQAKWGYTQAMHLNGKDGGKNEGKVEREGNAIRHNTNRPTIKEKETTNSWQDAAKWESSLGGVNVIAGHHDTRQMEDFDVKVWTRMQQGKKPRHVYNRRTRAGLEQQLHPASMLMWRRSSQ